MLFQIEKKASKLSLFHSFSKLLLGKAKLFWDSRIVRSKSQKNPQKNKKKPKKINNTLKNKSSEKEKKLRKLLKQIVICTQK